MQAERMYRSTWESLPPDCRTLTADGRPAALFFGGMTIGWHMVPVELVANPRPGPRFYWMFAIAWARGLFYRWPRQAPIRGRGYSGVSCGLRTFAEVKAMWSYGWEPWCFQRTRGLGVARLFRSVELTTGPEWALDEPPPRSRPGPSECPLPGRD